MLAREWRQINGTRPCSVAIFPNDNFAHPHDCYTIIFLNMSFTKRGNIITPNGTTIEVYEFTEHLMFPLDNPNYRRLQKILFLENDIIPDEIWPSENDDAPWEQFPHEYVRQMK
ncbi:hypothetical protein PanWU01x14_128150 [Parasponia andersonii]|uniref:Uncharacterized protein n=1 Tax=Parasponia andersonii TaxID=3476 RepID=A0A2P5CS04_PARAD|nr:hypothetical protein PanWU01x14_128150 [Parasponia andersonii]